MILGLAHTSRMHMRYQRNTIEIFLGFWSDILGVFFRLVEDASKKISLISLMIYYMNIYNFTFFNSLLSYSYIYIS